MVEKFNIFIKDNNDKLNQYEQSVINAQYYKKIDILPAKFGIFNEESYLLWLKYQKQFKYKYKYSVKELLMHILTL